MYVSNAISHILALRDQYIRELFYYVSSRDSFVTAISSAPSGAHVGWLVGDWTGLDLCYAHVAAACGPAEAHVEVMALQVLGVKVQADRAIMSASLHPIESHCPCQESVLA